MAKRTFERTSIIPATMEQMIAFHAHPKALQWLTPPPIFAQMHRDDRRSMTEGELEFTLWFGPIPFRWVARHEPGPTPTSFADRMVSGPLASWYHQHIFSEAPEGVRLTDRIELEHKPGLPGFFTRLMFDGLPLRILFFYRHLRTRHGVRKFGQPAEVNS